MLQIITNNVETDQAVNSFIINGDPGCDGYNTEAVIMLEETLRRKADFHLLIGDLVPTGNKHCFQQFRNIVDTTATSPVYCLPGNHDLPDYDIFCGRKDYYIKAPNVLVIMLDNSRRYFTDETLVFLQQTLRDQQHSKVFVSFHIPVPNSIVPNHISHDEWDKLETILAPYKPRIQAIFCGHVHSAFEFNIDGYRVIVTGGGGARLDPVDNTFMTVNQHHIFRVEINGDEWSPRIVPLNYSDIANPYSDDAPGLRVKNNLDEAFTGESLAYRRYLLFAKFAEKEGLPGIAKLFRAASESEFYHSENMYLASPESKSTHNNLQTSIQRENEETTRIYPGFINNTAEQRTEQAATAYRCALQAERIHHQFFSKALEHLNKNEDMPVGHIFTCSRCGYTHPGDHPPNLCPACGVDRFKFREVQ